MVDEFGRVETTRTIRQVLAKLRGELAGTAHRAPDEPQILDQVSAALRERAAPSLRPVYNLTGTVLHTNLGRASLSEAAIEAVTRAAAGAGNLEYRIDEGRRGNRDQHVEELLLGLTGAEAATVVNNNAAAVMLILNTFARGREVPVSRGELIEIGGSFRLPEIMERAGCKLVEVGTTNRTHLRDYVNAVSDLTGLVMKVHTSNYVVEGFTAEVGVSELSGLCRESGIPLAVDLGSGALVDLARYNLPHEPTPEETLSRGAELVTFSGDKLLGGPQAGIIAGSARLIAELNHNPMKRALRCDKLTIAALEATLRLYLNPDRIVERLPTLRVLARPVEEIRSLACRVRPAVDSALRGQASVQVTGCEGQIGSGALPLRKLASAGLAIVPDGEGKGGSLQSLSASFRVLPVPVIGRIHSERLVFDMRCLEDEQGFVEQLPLLVPGS